MATQRRRSAADGASLGGARAPTRVSDPDEAHERQADALARRFLAAQPTVAAAEVPNAFARFVGHDLSRVRIRADADTDARARELGTAAFTLGEDVGVARGRATPGVIAHELAHVVAQRSRPALAGTLWRQTPSDDDERRKQAATAGKPPVPFVHPFLLFGGPGDLFNRSMTARYPELKLGGSEWYGAWSLAWAGLNPLFQAPPVMGGDATPGKWTHDYTRFPKYVSALQKLTPGKGDPYLDVLSLATGTRVEDWLGHDRFLKEGLSKYWWQALIGLALAQAGLSTWAALAPNEPDKPGGLTPDPTFRHFGMLLGLGNAATKKFTTLGNNPLGVGVPIGNEAGLPSAGPLSTGLPSSGLTLDLQKGAGGAHKYSFGLPLNLGRMIRPDEAGKPKSPLELGLWGSYDENKPRLTLAPDLPLDEALAQLRSRTWSVGAHGGYDWHGALDYRFREAGGLRMHQGSLGLGYQPREAKQALRAGPLLFPRFGVNASYSRWTGADTSTYGPRLGSDRGDAWRLSPYLDLGIDLGKGYQLGLGGQASASFRGGTSPQRYLDGLRLMIALQHQRAGASELDKKRLELSYSQNRYEALDPKSPLIHALQLKGQWGPWFGGAQVNWLQGGLKALEGGPYARDFKSSADPMRDLSLLFMLGYRFGVPKYNWGLRP